MTTIKLKRFKKNIFFFLRHNVDKDDSTQLIFDEALNFISNGKLDETTLLIDFLASSFRTVLACVFRWPTQPHYQTVTRK